MPAPSDSAASRAYSSDKPETRPSLEEVALVCYGVVLGRTDIGVMHRNSKVCLENVVLGSPCLHLQISGIIA